MDFFESDNNSQKTGPSFLSNSELVPLAERMRPKRLEDYVGQEEIAGDKSPLRRLLNQSEQIRSMLFWGPPGSGKTTLAYIVAGQTRAHFQPISAVTASIKDVKQIMEQARFILHNQGIRTVLFVDEIHRFNKAQQDAFLPFIEDGSIVLIGATTENPSFSLVSALLSRCRVYILKALSSEALIQVLNRALNDSEIGLGKVGVEISENVLSEIASLSDGDARRALNLLELSVQLTTPDLESGLRRIDFDTLKFVLKREHLVYDKTGDEHFNSISALHKSLRASDVQAAVYWTTRMLVSGEDPMYVARRMVRFASEDIGNADPNALQFAISALESYRFLGSPEGNLALVQLASYLATAPKSNAIYQAEKLAKQEVATTGSLPVPMHIRNAPTKLMKTAGYGEGYQYDHDAEDGFSGQECLPDGVIIRKFYEPKSIGFEREISKRMEWWENKRSEKQKK